MPTKCRGDGESWDEEENEDSCNEVREKATTEGLTVNLLQWICEVHTMLEEECEGAGWVVGGDEGEKRDL